MNEVGSWKLRLSESSLLLSCVSISPPTALRLKGSCSGKEPKPAAEIELCSVASLRFGGVSYTAQPSLSLAT